MGKYIKKIGSSGPADFLPQIYAKNFRYLPKPFPLSIKKYRDSIKCVHKMCCHAKGFRDLTLMGNCQTFYMAEYEWIWLKWGNGFLVKIVGLDTCTSRAVKMKDHLLFCREFGTLCFEDRVIVDCVV